MTHLVYSPTPLIDQTGTDSSYMFLLEEGVHGGVQTKPPAHVESHLKEQNDPQYKKRMQEARKWLSEALSEVQPEQTLSKIRLSKGLSQRDLADIIGTSQPHIARIESGNDVKIETARKIAKVFGISLDEFDTAHKNSIKNKENE